MPSTITRYEIKEMAKDVIAFLKSKDYSADEIDVILRKAVGINEGTEPYFGEDE